MRLAPLPLILLVLFGLLPARGEEAIAPPTWALRYAPERGTSERFHFEHDGVSIEGVVDYQWPLRIHGVYRTSQAIDGRSQLAYHLYTGAGRLVFFEGNRSAWTTGEDGVREAVFDVKIAPSNEMRSVLPRVRVQFDYVVEGEYWQSLRDPGFFLPSVVIRPPPRPAVFTVPWAGVPRLFPSQGTVWLPAWVRAEYGVEPPPPYSAALDVMGPHGEKRIEAPRRVLPWSGIGAGLVWYRMDAVDVPALNVRPGFVWDGVKWFSAYAHNPYRRVRVLGPLSYLLAMGMAMGLWCLAGWGIGRAPRRWLRNVLWSVWGVGLVSIFSVFALSMYAAVMAGMVILLWMQRRVREPGVRLYWSLWGLLVLLDFFCLHVHRVAPGQWAGSAISAALAGLALLPLRWMRKRKATTLVGTGLATAWALIATAMMAYVEFFGDYPVIGDLGNSGQLGDVLDAVIQLLGQAHLVPWLLSIFVCVGLWWGGRGQEEPAARRCTGAGCVPQE